MIVVPKLFVTIYRPGGALGGHDGKLQHRFTGLRAMLTTGDVAGWDYVNSFLLQNCMQLDEALPILPRKKPGQTQRQYADKLATAVMTRRAPYLLCLRANEAKALFACLCDEVTDETGVPALAAVPEFWRPELRHGEVWELTPQEGINRYRLNRIRRALVKPRRKRKTADVVELKRLAA